MFLGSLFQFLTSRERNRSNYPDAGRHVTLLRYRDNFILITGLEFYPQASNFCAWASREPAKVTSPLIYVQSNLAGGVYLELYRNYCPENQVRDGNSTSNEN